MWVLQHHAVHVFDMSTVIVFVYLELQVKWSQFNSVVYIRGCMLGSGLTWWPQNQILSVHWNTPGKTTLEPEVHWDATWATLADASTQCCPSDDPVIICIIGTHWDATEKKRDDHWNALATNNYSPVAFKCILWSKFQASWTATVLPMTYHGFRVRVVIISCQCQLYWYIT